MKRTFAFLLALCICLTFVPLKAQAATSGMCGAEVNYSFTPSTGLLKIYGTGEMWNYSFNYDYANTPWMDFVGDIKKVEIGSGVTRIGRAAFTRCANLQSVTIASTVTSIGDRAFSGCTSLTEINIPDNVTAIGDYAFYRAGITELMLPDSLTSLGEAAFYQSCLTNPEIPAGITTVSSKLLYDCNHLESVTFRGDIVDIGESAFYGSTLKEVRFEGSLSGTIGEMAFGACGFTAFQIPGTVTQISDGAFKECDQLKEITFLGDAPNFSGRPFGFVTATVYYPAGNTTWTAGVMQNYGGTITWAPYSSSSEIASGWSGYTQWSLTYDGVLRIFGQGNMKNYGYGGGQPWLRYKDQITSVYVEKGVNSIGSGAFMNLEKLESVILPASGLTKIGEAAFYGCASLKEITIPGSIYTIWSYTFKNCSALAKVTFPKGLIKIDQGAFENCTSLKLAEIPSSVNIIGSWSFKGCTGLEKVDMYWATATEIREGAFKNCSSLTTVRFPVTVQKLGDSAFYGIGATAIVIPRTVTDVGPWCFARANLKQIYFQSNAPVIGEGAFNKITLTAYYPGNNATWTENVMLNYGGTVTWKAS